MAPKSEATLLLRIKEVGSEAISKTQASLGALKNFALAAYAEIATAVGTALKAWREQQEATNALNQSLVNQGLYTRQLSKDYHDMASELQGVTTFGDEAIIQAQATVQGYLGQIQVTKELTKSILDFATAQKMDAATAAQVLGKAIDGSTDSLGRSGLQIDGVTGKQERLAAVIEKVNGRFGGQAEASAQGLGSLLQMKNAIGEVFEAMGERLEPVVTAGANAFKSFALELSTNKNALDGFAAVVKGAVQSGSFLKMVFMDLGQIIGQVFGTAVAGVAQVFEGKWKQAWETFKSIPSDSTTIVKDNYTKFTGEMDAIDKAFIAKKADNLKKQQDMEDAAAANSIIKQQEANDAKRVQQQLNDEQKLINQQIAADLEAGISHEAQLSRVNQAMLTDQAATTEFELEQKKRILSQKITNDEFKKNEEDLFKFRQAKRQAEIADQQSTFSTIATLSKSNNGALAALGKAAALTQIAIQTPVAVSRALAAFPPPFNFVAAAGVAAAMAAQTAQVMGVQLAEGGIVRASQGGTQATIGEGGSDEAVIPLDSPEAMSRLGGGGGTTINFNGPIMGNESQAREFAIAIDRELFRLRRDGESVSFDSRLS